MKRMYLVQLKDGERWRLLDLLGKGRASARKLRAPIPCSSRMWAPAF